MCVPPGFIPMQDPLSMSGSTTVAGSPSSEIDGADIERSSRPTFRARAVTKTFGHIEALRGVDLDLWSGTVTGLVGDNGAGKSTLIKALAGGIKVDRGTFELDGRALRLRTPCDARRAGIETVYQDLALAPDLNAVQNLYLGREMVSRRFPAMFGILDDKAMRKAAPTALARLTSSPPNMQTPVGALSGGQRQIVAIARATMWAPKLLLLDEPTAALGPEQTRHVQTIVRAAAETGSAVLIISHNLPELLRFVDRIVVMRLGRVVADWSSETVTSSELLAAMTGFSSDASAAQ